jgi:hypothetical protein
MSASRPGRRGLFLVLCTVVSCVAFATSASRANSGTQLPLSQYQPGTESTTLVPNGNFETVASGDAGAPWTEPITGMGAGSHVSGTNTNASVFGNLAAQAGATDNATYRQALTIDPAQNYVLSAYMWDFGNPGPAPHTPADNDPGDQAVVELISGGTKSTILLEPIALDNGNASQGYFLYTNVPAGTFGAATGVDLEVRNDLDTPGPWPAIVTQFDNVALTPAGQFSPPTQVPGPAATSLLAAGCFALLRRRR